jgi:hypothetical protein
MSLRENVEAMRPLHRLRRSPSPVNGGGPGAVAGCLRGSSPAKRGRRTMRSMVEGAPTITGKLAP